MKTSITKSRAGHYTLTVRDARGNRVLHQPLIDNLYLARRILAAFKKIHAEHNPK